MGNPHPNSGSTPGRPETAPQMQRDAEIEDVTPCSEPDVHDLTRLGDAADLVQALQSPVVSVRVAACEALALLNGADTGEALMAAAHDGSSAVRRAALASLDKRGDERVVDQYLRVLEEDLDEPLLAQAASALSRMGEPRAALLLARRLSVKRQQCARQAAEKALAQVSINRAAAELVASDLAQRLDAHDYWTAQAEGGVLGRAGFAELAMPLLVARLTDKTIDTVIAVASMLSSLGWMPETPQEAQWQERATFLMSLSGDPVPDPRGG